MMQYIPDTKVGEKFGRLTFLGLSHRCAKSRQWFWRVKCDCGAEKVVMGANVRHGKTNSCGCYQKDRASESHKTHGKSGTMLHTIWKNMKQRCYNIKNERYVDYGGRGIVMSDSWRNDFNAFSNDVGEPPSPSHSLDRIDNDKGYCKENVRWATDKMQVNNRRNSIWVKHNGDSPLSGECERLGVNYYRAYDMIVRRKIDPTTAFEMLKNSKETPI